MILLHGLFGALSNWNDVTTYFESKYDIHVPLLPIYEARKGDGLENMVKFLEEYIESAKLENVILIGNSLGGHVAIIVAIIYVHKHPEKVNKLILTGSSGLYENTDAGSYVKRGNRSYIQIYCALRWHKRNPEWLFYTGNDWLSGSYLIGHFKISG